MSILSIEEVSIQDDVVEVKAIIEDASLRYTATYFDPPEYVPALCYSSFTLDEELPVDNSELLEYIESLDLDWEVVEDDYDDYS